MTQPLLIPVLPLLSVLSAFQAPAQPPTPRLHESVVVTAAAEPVPFESAGPRRVGHDPGGDRPAARPRPR